MSQEEKELQISPIVNESVQHNARTVSTTRNLTASLFGIAAGTLGLESYPGFLFYLLGTLLVSALLYGISAEGRPGRYFYRQLGDLWAGELVSGASSFVLTWTLVFGLVKT